jgi:Ca2+:H+ antiporter
MLKTHPKFFASRNRPPKDGHAAGPGWSRGAALAVLVGASVGLAFASETLVGSVEETAKSLGLSKAFIGIILLSVIGGSAECYAAVSMAAKNQLDLTMGIAVGSGLQIAMFIAPALVLCSQAIGPQPMNLVVGTAGAFVIFLSVLVTMLVAGDGKAHWFKGVLLLCAYGLIALFCYYLPDDLSAARQR